MAGSRLQIDTELLKQAATAAEKANEEITQAMEMINRVTEHNDWNCKKRDVINSYASENRQAIGIIQSNSSSFYSAVKEASRRFSDKEEELARNSNRLDDIISSIIVKVPTIGGGIGSAAGSVGVSIMSEIASSLGPNGGKNG